MKKPIIIGPLISDIFFTLCFTLGLLWLNPAQAWWVATEGGLHFENDSETNSLKNRTPIGIVVGHQEPIKYEYSFELSSFSVSSGNATLTIDRTNYTALGSFRYHPFALDGFSWYPYFAGLGGFYFETVDTKFMGHVDQSTGSMRLLGGVGLGVWGNVYRQLRAGAEFRSLFGQDLSPVLTPEILIRIGLDF